MTRTKAETKRGGHTGGRGRRTDSARSARTLAREVSALKRLHTGLVVSSDPKRANEVALNQWAEGATWALEWVLNRMSSPAEHNANMRKFARAGSGRRGT